MAEIKEDKEKLMEIASALNEVIRIRGVTLVELSKRTGVDQETLQDYTMGLQDIRNASASEVFKIADALRVDPAILMGEKSIDEFHKKVAETEIDRTSLENLRRWLETPIRASEEKTSIATPESGSDESLSKMD